MRIVFDVYELTPGQGKSIGIYNYAKYLLQALARNIEAGMEIIVFCNPLNVADFTVDHPAFSTRIFTSTSNKFSRLLWFFLIASLKVRNVKANLYFSPKGFLPFGIKRLNPKIKTVVVTHDLIPLWYAEHYPGYFGRAEELFINYFISASAKSADKVVAISQATADDIEQRLGRKHDVTVVHNGIEIVPPGPKPFEEAYLFAMTSALPHKNSAGILAAYKAYRGLTDQPLPLFLCGVQDCSDEGVTILSKLDNSTLHAYYAYASLFIFLSRIEGFGFPPVEALAHGTPVICSNISSLREVSKNLANFVPLDEPELIGATIVKLLAQSDTESQRNERVNILKYYTWDSCAKKIIALFKN